MPETIEDIILDQDKRGMLALRPHLPPDFCRQAGQFALENSGESSGLTLIATGFYVLMAGRPETDGPPGAIAIGRALQALGRRVIYVTDQCSAPMLRGLEAGAAVWEFPALDAAASRRYAAAMLARLRPSLLISIERCGRNAAGAYLNMRGRDISDNTAGVDYLFDGGVPSIGIGDGGNEIGMGNLAAVIPSVPSLPDDPAVSTVDRLVIASVSNWGGYGLAAALSQLAGRNLLPSVAAETELIHRMIAAGAVDGTTGAAVPTVDDFSAAENGAILTRLHRLVDGG